MLRMPYNQTMLDQAHGQRRKKEIDVLLLPVMLHVFSVGLTNVVVSSCCERETRAMRKVKDYETPPDLDRITERYLLHKYNGTIGRQAKRFAGEQKRPISGS